MNGEKLSRRALFFHPAEYQHASLAEKLGCQFMERDVVRTDEYEATNVSGLYVAGDASRLMQLAIVAASEGALAAFAINTTLLREELA